MSRPIGLEWRSSTTFILITVGVLLFSDLFLFSLIVPILPYILENQAEVPSTEVQGYVSLMLTAFSATGLMFHPIVAWAADKIRPRKVIYISGVIMLAISTALLIAARTFPLLLLSRMFQGASGSICWVMGMTLCVETVGSHNLGKVIGSLYGVIIFGQMFAPTIGGMAYHLSGMSLVISIALGIVGLDFILRLLVIEKGDAARYDIERHSPSTGVAREHRVDERRALLSYSDEFKIAPPENFILTRAPILCCLRSQSMIVAITMVFVEAIFLSSLNATVSLHAYHIFGFNSFQSGLLMLAIGGPVCVFGPPAGWCVDRFGTKYLSVIGCTICATGLVLLRLPIGGDNNHQVVLYACFLAVCGLGIAVIDTTGIVESIIIAKKFHASNPGLFGKDGPFIQHNALIGTVFSMGTSLGPLASGGLTTALGYATMTTALGLVAGVMALTSFLWLEGTPKFYRSRRSIRTQP